MSFQEIQDYTKLSIKRYINFSLNFKRFLFLTYETLKSRWQWESKHRLARGSRSDLADYFERTSRVWARAFNRAAIKVEAPPTLKIASGQQ